MSTKAYWPALDGLRGVAILLVIAGHIGLAPISASLAPCGVAVFFVLSGFLITNVLVRLEGRLSTRLARFYGARLARLFPAMAITVAAVLALWTTLGHDPRTLAGSAAAAMAYVQNFARPATQPTALTHTWSLAVEEQFYILWPFALLLLRRSAPRVRAFVILFAIVTSLAVRFALFKSGDYDAAYAALPSNAYALLLGCFIGLAPVRVPRWIVPISAAALLLVFVVAAVGLPAPLFTAPVLAAGATSGLLLGAVGGSSVLEWRPLRFIGGVSYSWYLWHWPLLVLAGSVDTPWPGAAIVTIALAIAVISTKWIEQPIRRRWHAVSARFGVKEEPQPVPDLEQSQVAGAVALGS